MKVEFELSALDIAVIAAYLLTMIAMGWALASRIRQFKDYFLAGGALTTPLLICTLVSSYYGLDVTFGTSESGFYYGISAWLWYSCPYYAFILVATLVIARRLKRHDCMTLPDLLDRSYGPSSRVVGAAACFIYSLPIIEMSGMTGLMEMVGMSREGGLLLVIAVCTVYTILGGLWADAITDTVQFVLMCVSLAVAIPIALNWVGGFSFVEHLPAEHMQAAGGKNYWLLASWAAAGTTVLVEPAFYQRVLAAKDQRAITRALILGIGLWAAYDWGVVMIGMIAQAAVQMKLEGMPADLEGKHALLAVCGNVLPMGLRGLFLGGILSAAMSTIDTYSLLASGNLVYDIYRPLRRKPMSDRQLILLTRIGVVVVMLTGAALSLLFDKLRDAWMMMASVLSSVTLVPVMGALFTRPRPAAGLCAALAGAASLTLFYVLVIGFGEWDTDEESFVYTLGSVELWRDAAALFTIPISALGFFLGNTFGRPKP